MTGGQVVQDPHSLAAPGQCCNQVRTDEPCSPGDEITDLAHGTSVTSLVGTGACRRAALLRAPARRMCPSAALGRAQAHSFGRASMAETPLDAFTAADVFHDSGVLDLPRPSALLDVLELASDFLLELLVDRHVALQDRRHLAAQLDVFGE